MRRALSGIAVVVVLALIASQLVIPSRLSGEIEQRLERGGGSAEVTLRGWPALLMLGGRGEELDVTGSGLAFDLGGRRDVSLERLEGFERVLIELEDSDVGPIEADRIRLARRDRDAEYELIVTATTTPRELAAQIGDAAGGTLGGVLGSLAGSALPDGGRTAVPLSLRASIDSVDGRAEVTDASGSVAGVPAGSLARVVVEAVLERL